MANRKKTACAVLDIGSSKICCLIAEPPPLSAVEDDQAPQVFPTIIGASHFAAKGIKNGAVSRLEDAQAVVAKTLEAAEEQAGRPIDKVLVNISTGTLVSEVVRAEMQAPLHPIRPQEVEQLLARCQHQGNTAERFGLHKVPLHYQLDDNTTIEDPIGMHGSKFAVRVHMVSASAHAVRTLGTCIRKAHSDIEAFVVSPYASALGCFDENVREIGATIIDIGAGTTTYAVMQGQRLLYAGAIPLGGGHITADLAHGLRTSLAEAERLKILHGHALANSSDTKAMSVTQVDDQAGEPTQIARHQLRAIIAPRVEEIFEWVKQHLAKANAQLPLSEHRVFLTGGTSLLPGIDEAAQRILSVPVRLIQPRQPLPDICQGPGFACAAGLLAYRFQAQRYDLPQVGTLGSAGGSWWRRVQGWMAA